MWHYFVNDIYFSEYGENTLTPFTITINVKEKDNGDFVYSFNAEKEFPTRRTFHAGVNTRKGANGELFLDNSISKKTQNVKTNSENSSEVMFCIRENRANEFNPDGRTLNEQLTEAFISAESKD